MAIPLGAQSAGLSLVCPNSIWGNSQEYLPPLTPFDRSLQNDVADGTTVTVPVGCVALSAEK